MKVTQLRLASCAGRPELLVDRFSPALNVLTGQSGAGKSAVAQLASHLLYGKHDGVWRRQFLHDALLAEGSIEVECPQGTYLLRRHRDGGPHGRLSIASAGGAAVDSQTIRTLLSNVSPRLLVELYAVDFAEPPQVLALLSGEFAREFSQTINPGPDVSTGAVVGGQHSPVPSAILDRSRVDRLIRQRDATVREIEKRMSASRRESGALERELQQLDAALSARRTQAEDLQARLRAADAKLAEIATTLRYFSIQSTVDCRSTVDEDYQRAQLDALDAEIARSRQTLGEMQLRDAAVRRELAQVHPDGTADSASCLADQRATIGIFEQLLDDLDAEVAQLARSHEPGRCAGCNAHARLLPATQLLRRQLYVLCGQVTEQQRSVRRMQLHAEARQLARGQTDVGEQLEHLLQRRQTIVYESDRARRPAALLPHGPAAGHCRCRSHAEFVRGADAMLPADGDRSGREESIRTRRDEQERERDEIRAEYDALQREIENTEARWRMLQQSRAQASSRSSLDELRAELDRLETEIHRTLSGEMPAPAATNAASHRQPWKASDALAQLTDGQLVQIRMNRGGATIVDRAGQALAISELSPSQYDQLCLAVTLALVSSLASRGIDLPLFLDEPFLRQDPRSAAAMAGVLDEFAGQGRQIIVFTGDDAAVRRFQSLGAVIRDLDAIPRHGEPREATIGPVPSAAPEKSSPAPTLRIVRETPDEPQSPSLGGNVHQPTGRQPTYFISVDASMADFPVFGSDTAKVFAGLGIRTIEQLLAADAAKIAADLKRPQATAYVIRLWQTHLALMCFVPGVSLNDAQVLAANDVNSPEALFTIDVRLLADSIAKFLDSDRGGRFALLRGRFTRNRLVELQKLARSQRERWQHCCARFPWVDRPSLPDKRAVARIAQVPRPSLGAAGRKPTREARRRPLRFLLDRTSSVAAAPSISPHTAAALAKVGVRTVADLLNADPQSTADEMATPRVTADVVTRWQREARLACRIPELRNRGARLLIGCGLTEAEQVAGADPAKLAKTIRSFCRSPAGKRILGASQAPSRARISQWVRHAAKRRPLDAA